MKLLDFEDYVGNIVRAAVEEGKECLIESRIEFAANSLSKNPVNSPTRLSFS